jgi:hypothetical protein
MSAKKLLIFTTALALVLGVTACKRHDVDQPSPVGPSTLATVLKVSANPNVITAGSQHAGTTISVSLRRFDGTPIVGRTVTFEICDSFGNPVDIGYFEGHENVLSRQTDGSGNISLTYFGPLNSDIAASTIVNIWATAAAEGDETIQDFTPINIILDAVTTDILLEVIATPNIISAGTDREHSVIAAYVRRVDGLPLAGRTVYFEINDDSDVRSHIGYFKEENPVASAVTNSSGRAAVTYYGPLKSEIGTSRVLHIWASTPGAGDPFIQNYAELFIIR